MPFQEQKQYQQQTPKQLLKQVIIQKPKQIVQQIPIQIPRQIIKQIPEQIIEELLAQKQLQELTQKEKILKYIMPIRERNENDIMAFLLKLIHKTGRRINIATYGSYEDAQIAAIDLLQDNPDYKSYNIKPIIKKGQNARMRNTQGTHIRKTNNNNNNGKFNVFPYIFSGGSYNA